MPPKDDDDLGDLDTLSPGDGEEDNLDPTGELDEGEEPESPDEGEEPEGEEQDLAAQPGTEQPPPQQRQPGRRDKRVDSLLQRARQSEKQLTESNRRIDELLATIRAGQQPSTTQVESAAQREARRAQLTPEERVQEDIRESERRITSQFQNLQGATWDQSDRTLYETKASTDPIYKKWSPRVEQEYQRLRQNGAPAPRETILAYLIGKTMLEGRAGKGSRRQVEAERRVRSNTTKPGGARSDVRGERRGGGKSLEERLTNIPI